MNEASVDVGSNPDQEKLLQAFGEEAQVFQRLDEPLVEEDVGVCVGVVLTLVVSESRAMRARFTIDQKHSE